MQTALQLGEWETVGHSSSACDPANATAGEDRAIIAQSANGGILVIACFYVVPLSFHFA